MSEEGEKTLELSDSILQQIQQIVKQNPSLTGNSAKELGKVLTSLAALPFKDDTEQASYLERVQRLQGYHIIQTFNLGVDPLQKSLAESAELLEEVIQLVEICLTFCYTTDVSKRVSFDYYVRALRFCFPSEKNQHLSTKVVSKLLELVQVCQEEGLSEIVCEKTKQDASPSLQIHGARYFFAEILQILEARRHEDCLNEIIEQTVRFASADAKIKCIQRRKIGEVILQSEHVVSPVHLASWMKLLKLKNVRNGFAFSLAKVDSLSHSRTKEIIPSIFGRVVVQTNHTYQSTVCCFVRALEEMEKKGLQVGLPHDKERLEIFLSYLEYFCNHSNMTAKTLQFLATTDISNEVLKEVFNQFFCKDKMATDLNKPLAFELLFKVLTLLPNGEVAKKALNLWRQVCFDDASYQTLVCLFSLFVEESNRERDILQERAEKILDFLEWLPRPLVRSISFWQRLFLYFVRIFPTTFQRRPEVLIFIQKAVLAEQCRQRQVYAVLEQGPILQSLEWLSQQSCTEELKSEMIWLIMCSTDRVINLHSSFETEVIKSLTLCPRVSFNTKKAVVHELTRLASLLKEKEKMGLKKIIENVTTSQTFEITDEVFFEVVDFVKRFVVHEMPEDVLELLSLLPGVPISNERVLKVMQFSKKSRKGLHNGVRILQSITRHQWVLEERTNEFFDLLFAAVFKTLKGDDGLCEKFFIQNRFQFPSSEVLNVWTSLVAGLMSLGLFKEKIDSRCCRVVLQQAYGFSSPLEILQLLSQVRSTAARVIHLSSRGHVESTSCNVNGETDLANFVETVTTILGTDMLSSSEKMLLIKKVCDVVLTKPAILTTTCLKNAMTNLISCQSWQQNSSSSSNEDVNPEFGCILTVMENPTVMFQLSRIPQSERCNFLCDVLSKNMSKSFCKNNFADIYIFIGSLKDFDQAFFDHLVSFVEEIIHESMSVEDVLEVLQELVQVLRNIRSEVIPITMFNFAYLFRNSVEKQERDKFLSDVAIRWALLPKHYVLSFLEVTRLLWKAYTTATTSERRHEIIDRVQEILKKSSKVEDWIERNALYLESYRDFILRKIACCELEWLVFHSCLSTEDAALAFDLSGLSFRKVFNRHLRCVNFSEVQISEDGVFKFVPQERKTELQVDISSNDAGTASGVDWTSTENSSPITEPQRPILTPILVAKEVIFHVKRVLGQDENPSENAFLLWKLLFEDKRPFRCYEAECVSKDSTLDDYAGVFLKILAKAPSIEIMLHWAKLDKHHVCQCSDVILKACEWKGDDNDEEALSKLQSVVSTTLEKMRLNTRATHLTPWALSFAGSCFRILKPQLIHMGYMLERKFPIEVTTRVFELYQISGQAALTVVEIISLWSSTQQSLKLVEEVQSFCKGDEMASLNPAQSEFAWQLLRAFGRFCMDSSKVLLNKFKELIVLHDPEDAYGLNRLPKWREMMIADGVPARVIDSWCAAFLMTPLEDLTSRDVDAIVDLNSSSLGLVTSVSQIIRQCIFPEDGFEVTKGVGIKENQVKERIRLARLLGEFINILKLRKPDENPKDAVVRDIVIDACVELCKSHGNIHRRRNDLYKIHGQKLKALFTEIFGKRRRGEDGQVSIQDSGVTYQEGEQELKVVASVARQPSHLHENLPTVLSHTHVYEPMLVLLRRWLSGISKKPTLASCTLEIVQLLFSLHPSDVGPDLLDVLHDSIKTCILSLERNRSLVAQLQASGYNQRFEGIPDLWMSHSLELPCYLSKRESLNSRLFTKKLTKVLRRLWNEWKDILFMLGIVSIKVGEDEMCTKDLFGVQAELDEMEEQATAIKEVVKQIDSEDLDRRVKELMRLEQRHRARIQKLYKSNKVSGGSLVIVRPVCLSFFFFFFVRSSFFQCIYIPS